MNLENAIFVLQSGKWQSKQATSTATSSTRTRPRPCRVLCERDPGRGRAGRGREVARSLARHGRRLGHAVVSLLALPSDTSYVGLKIAKRAREKRRDKRAKSFRTPT